MLRLLRWKNRYLTGDEIVDQQNKKLFSCVNQLLGAADQREHCEEMTGLLSSLSKSVENKLKSQAQEDKNAEFREQLIQKLPLDTYRTTACRHCGLCELAQAKIAEHLEAPLQCLAERWQQEKPKN